MLLLGLHVKDGAVGYSSNPQLEKQATVLFGMLESPWINMLNWLLVSRQSCGQRLLERRSLPALALGAYF